MATLELRARTGLEHCPYCRAPLCEAQFTPCRGCATALHDVCWSEHGSCTTCCRIAPRALRASHTPREARETWRWRESNPELADQHVRLYARTTSRWERVARSPWLGLAALLGVVVLGLGVVEVGLEHLLGGALYLTFYALAGTEALSEWRSGRWS